MIKILNTVDYLGGGIGDTYVDCGGAEIDSINSNKIAIYPISVDNLGTYGGYIGNPALYTGFYRLKFVGRNDGDVDIFLNENTVATTRFTPVLNEINKVLVYNNEISFIIFENLNSTEYQYINFKNKYNILNINDDDNINSENIDKYIYSCVYIFNDHTGDVTADLYTHPGTDYYKKSFDFDTSTNPILTSKYDGEYNFDSEEWFTTTSNIYGSIAPLIITIPSGYSPLWIRSKNHYIVNEFPQQRGIHLNCYAPFSEYKILSLMGSRIANYTDKYYKYYLSENQFTAFDSDISNYEVDTGETYLNLDTTDYSAGDYYVHYYRTDKYCRVRPYYYFNKLITVNNDESITYGPTIPTFTVDILRNKYIKFIINYNDPNYAINKLDIKINGDVYTYTFSQTVKLQNKVIKLLADKYEYGEELTITMRAGRNSVYSAYSEDYVIDFFYKNVPTPGIINATINTVFNNRDTDIETLIFETTVGDIHYYTSPLETYLDVDGDRVLWMSNNELTTDYNIIDNYNTITAIPTVLYDDGIGGYYMGGQFLAGIKIDTTNKILYICNNVIDDKNYINYNTNNMMFESLNQSYILYYDPIGNIDLFYGYKYNSVSDVKNIFKNIKQV